MTKPGLPTILAIDDLPQNLEILGAALEKDCNFRVALSGEEGLESIAAVPPDLVLLDVMLPGIDGMEVLRRLRADPATRHLPVIIVTSVPDKEGELDGLRLGADDYLYKPFDAATTRARIRNVIERQKVRRELELAARAFERRDEGMAVTDASGAILSVNAAFSAITGYRPEEVIGRTPAILRSGRHPPEFYRDMWTRIENEGTWQGEIWNRRKDGTVYLEWLSISSIQDGDGKVANYVAVFSDMAAIRAAKERLEFVSTRDPLTGLPNRALFADRLQHALNRRQRQGDSMVVMFLDLDNFKHINDSLGHDCGDELLREAALRLRTCMRAADTLSRLGGDEFAMLMESCDRYAAADAAQRMVNAFAEPFMLKGTKAFISASIGVCVAPDDGTDARALLSNADAAMYRVKKSGRNGFQFFAAEMAAQTQARLAIESGLREAIEKDELFLLYQPQIEIATGRLAGAEALIRWQRGDKAISPAAFIPIAEESDIIVHIGEWVLDKVSEQLAGWKRLGRPLPRISVNLSGRHFARASLPQEIADRLARHGLEPRHLAVEMTENSLVSASDQVLDVLRAIRAQGVTLSTDDFGTGYSSLSYLKRYPIDELKIDRSFVEGIADEPGDAAIAAAIIQMAHTLGMHVVAEGVETADQLAVLQQRGCDLAQGYHLARPLSADDLTQLIAEGSPATPDNTN